MTTKDYFLSKIDNAQDLDLDEAYAAFLAVISNGDMPEFDDIYPDAFEDMPKGEQIADRFLEEVVPQLGIEPADFAAEAFYAAAEFLN